MGWKPGKFIGKAADKLGIGDPLDIVDPLNLIHSAVPSDREQMEAIQQFGAVAGYGGFGEEARDVFYQSQGNRIADVNAGVDAALGSSAEAGRIAQQQGIEAQRMANARNQLQGQTNMSREAMGGQAQMMTNVGMLDRAQLQHSGQQAYGDITGAGQGTAGAIAQAGRQGAGAIMSAAVRPETSLAEAQLIRGQMDAERQAQSVAATMGRGGNQALASRMAMNQAANVGSQQAADMAILRAQEEAAIRQGQMGAAQAAGQLNLAGVQGAGQALMGSAQAANAARMTGLSGGAQIGQGALQGSGQLYGAQGNLALGQTGIANQAALAGADNSLQGTQLSGNLGLGVANQQGDMFTTLSGQQIAADTGGEEQQFKEDTFDAANRANILAGGIGALAG